jgi:hypothetical protein
LKPFGKTDKILGGAGYRAFRFFFLITVSHSFCSGDDFPQEYLIYSLKEISIFLEVVKRKDILLERSLP